MLLESADLSDADFYALPKAQRLEIVVRDATEDFDAIFTNHLPKFRRFVHKHHGFNLTDSETQRLVRTLRRYRIEKARAEQQYMLDQYPDDPDRMIDSEEEERVGPHPDGFCKWIGEEFGPDSKVASNAGPLLLAAYQFEQCCGEGREEDQATAGAQEERE